MTPQDERALMSGLSALRERSRSESAPAHVEQAVLQAYAGSTRPRRRVAFWISASAIAAALAVVTVALAWRSMPIRNPPAPKREQAAHQPPVPPKVVAPGVAHSVVSEAVAPVGRGPLHRAQALRKKPGHVLAKPAQPQEGTEQLATGFLPIPDAPPLYSDSGISLVRIELPRSSLRAFGLPYNENASRQKILADVALGEDGIARAVRFLH